MQQEIRSVIARHQLCFLGIVESKVRDYNIDNVSKSILPQNWGFYTNIDYCSSGRIWVCWGPNVIVNTLYVSDQIVHCSF